MSCCVSCLCLIDDSDPFHATECFKKHLQLLRNKITGLKTRAREEELANAQRFMQLKDEFVQQSRQIKKQHEEERFLIQSNYVKQIELLTSEVEQLKQTHDDVYTDNLEQIRASCVELVRKERDKHREHIDQCTTEYIQQIQELQHTIESNKHAYKQLHEQYNASLEQINEKRTMIKELTTQHTSDIEHMRTDSLMRMKEFMKQIKEYNATIIDLNKQLSTYKEQTKYKHDTLVQQLTALEEKFENQRTLQNKKHALETESIQQTIQQWKEKYNQACTDIRRLRTENEQKSQQLKKFENTEQDNALLTKHIKGLQYKIKDLQLNLDKSGHRSNFSRRS